MRNNDKQAVLEELRPVRRLERLYRLLCREVEILGLDMEIQNRAREQMADNQRDYYLREQMKPSRPSWAKGRGAATTSATTARRSPRLRCPTWCGSAWKRGEPPGQAALRLL